ncbi:MAG: glycosyltransferase, partial [Planctomycetota bacterium]
LHRLFLVALYHRHEKDVVEPLRRYADAALPTVTVQLPLYNERTVAVRLLDAVARFDYPRDRLEVQVLDDSTDETADLVAAHVALLRDGGLDIRHIRRGNRTGYKAGALAAGLQSARGEFIAIFDADFVPQPGFLRDTIHHFTEPRIGLVQARWAHLNRRYSWLTRMQAMLLDAHFNVEHFARNRSGRIFNFNGTAGIWRRRTIDDAGGWQHDTLTEDLDLSYRAQLRGWQFVYLPTLDAPAELPVEMDAFKSQQYRWTKGSVQVARKLLPQIWRAPLREVPLRVRLEATIHLTANITYLLMIVLALLIGPAVYFRASISGWNDLLFIDLPIFFFGTLAVADFFLTGQRRLGRTIGQCVFELPLCLAVGMGLAVNNSRAVLSALLRRESEFVRTPKYNVTDAAGAPELKVRRYSPNRSWLPYVEVALGLYFLLAIAVAVSPGVFALPSLPFLLLFSCGFLYCGVASIFPRYRRAARRRSAAAASATALQLPPVAVEVPDGA